MKSLSFLFLPAAIILPLSLNAARSINVPQRNRPRIVIARGGSSTTTTKIREEDDDNDDEEKNKKEVTAFEKYRMDQQELLQLRSIILSEALAKRGLPLKTRLEVSTAAGQKPPEIVDWDCAMSTTEEPKSCLISFDAEPNTKVIAPLDTDDWISLAALNRLRRTDPTKVEPMWHSKYAILKSWFNDESSNYCILQQCGLEGIALAIVLNNPQKSLVLKSLLVITMSWMILLLLPVWNFVVNRFFVSSTVWMNWKNWARFVHAPFPLKLYLAQLTWKGLAKIFNDIEKRVRDFLIELECTVLEERMSLTIGPGSEVVVEDDEEEEEEFPPEMDSDDDDCDTTITEELDDEDD